MHHIAPMSLKIHPEKVDLFSMNADTTEADTGPGRLLAELRIRPPADLPLPSDQLDDECATAPRVATKPPSKMVERKIPAALTLSVPPLSVTFGTAPVAPLQRMTTTAPVDAPSTAPSTVTGPAVATPITSPVTSPMTTPAHVASVATALPASPVAPVAGAPVPPDPAEEMLEIEDGETTLFEAAIGAFHAGEFQRAESLFLEEAERALDSTPQRAAIAFRQAALAARQGGNADGSDHWMRLAGREYLKVSEDDRTPLPFIREAALMAAKCFLSVENLQVASKGLRRAQAIDSVLRADDDLLSRVPDIPFRHGDTVPTPVVSTLIPPSAPPTAKPRPSGPPVNPGHRPLHRGRWLTHLKLGRPSHGMV
jgi:hypothetical protein